MFPRIVDEIILYCTYAFNLKAGSYALNSGWLNSSGAVDILSGELEMGKTMRSSSIQKENEKINPEPIDKTLEDSSCNDDDQVDDESIQDVSKDNEDVIMLGTETTETTTSLAPLKSKHAPGNKKKSKRIKPQQAKKFLTTLKETSHPQLVHPLFQKMSPLMK
jgi:hypothetical protein